MDAKHLLIRVISIYRLSQLSYLKVKERDTIERESKKFK